MNITPLLDLAFVLLVIFILTTTPLANDIDLKLPAASKHQKDPPHKANYITVQATATCGWTKPGGMAGFQENWSTCASTTRTSA